MAVRIDASGDKLYRTANLPARDNFTIAGWCYIHSNRSAYAYFFCLEDATTNANGYAVLGFTNSNVMQLATTNGVANFNSTPSTGGWVYIYLKCDNSTNPDTYTAGWKPAGGSWTTVARQDNLTFTPAWLAIGNDSYDEWCDMSFERVRVWDAALSSTELDSEMASATPVRTSNLRSNYPLTTSTDLNDTTANGYHLTAGGTLSTTTPGPFGALADLTASGITTGAPTLGTPTIAQIHVLTAAGITTAAPALGTPSLAGEAQLTAAAITTGDPTLGTPTLTQVHVLTAAGITAGVPSVGSPSTVPLLGACIGGVLTVDSTNPRYFRNDSGIVVLAGFHTWYEFQDGDDVWPIVNQLDYTAWLDYIDARGTNFHKMWVLETARQWSDIDHYFDPLPYQRTGPGNAADGRLKFDLSAFNQEYFDRLRQRVILAGNRGHYVGVQLFQGWNISIKGYFYHPFTYHPYRYENNINGIDGDPNDDLEGFETRNLANTAIIAYQQAYIEKVVDTLNDLDNIIWEISNEETGDTTTDAWQYHWIDHIHTYEAGKAKQHPVGMTVAYPNGSNTVLHNSNADWISTNDGSLPPATDGSQVSLMDSDHFNPNVTGVVWIWRAFCRGHNVLFMDGYDGACYGVDLRNDSNAELIRHNLGYVLDYAARLDMANATPQGALSSTGYALAKTIGGAQILAYQDGSGAFTVNLTSISGTFALEWLRTANGTTQAGSNVSGGATRTLTPPWSGEDVLAFLELIGYDLTAAGITAGAPALGTPTLGQAHALTAAAIATGAASVAAATLAQVHALAAADAAAGTPTLDAPTIAQIHALTATVITAGVPVLGAPSMSGESALSAADIVTGAAALDAPTLAQVHVLAAVAIVTGAPALDTPAIGQTHALSVGDVATGAPTLGAPSMTGEAALTATDIAAGAPVLDAPAITQVHALAAVGVATSAAAVGTPGISQIHILTAVLIVAAAPTLGAPSLDRAVMPTPAERTFVVGWEDRTFVVSAESRTYIIGE